MPTMQQGQSENRARAYMTDLIAALERARNRSFDDANDPGAYNNPHLNDWSQIAALLDALRDLTSEEWWTEHVCDSYPAAFVRERLERKS